MSLEVLVASHTVTIHHGDAVLVTATDGAMTDPGRHGLFASDTRVLSAYRLLIGGKAWKLATSSALGSARATYYLVSPNLTKRRQRLPPGALELHLKRALAGHLAESMTITNYSAKHVNLHFAIELASDFADVFDVKARKLVDRGDIDVSWDPDRRCLRTQYRNEGFRRGLIYQVEEAKSACHYANGRLRFPLSLAPGERWSARCCVQPITDEMAPASFREESRPRAIVESAASSINQFQESWTSSCTQLSLASDAAEAYKQAVNDIGSLRLHRYDIGDDLFLPAGGVPWFVALFGRDSIITALESICVTTRLARGTLQQLAVTQASERDDEHDAQPGKIVHEMRFGELAALGIVPHARYYGTADATILYLILLSETWRWTADEKLLRKHRDTALRCLDWIDRYGDLDGDGLQEYKTFSPRGYHNQSWKDAENALVYPDGKLVQQPIATCELQGYVFDAKLRMAELLAVLGDSPGGDQLRRDAATLQKRVDEAFWMPEEGTYAFALDPDKRPVRSIASNAGHLLWSRIVSDEEKARRVMERLLSDDMFSGWGVRTLSNSHPAYNPHSYQCGSVWPHDNAIIAAGARRYGLWREANRICEGIFAACRRFQNQRLPELFAGVDRYPDELPVQYLGANAPQAWASGSILLMFQTMLGINADAPNGLLQVAPRLPQWVGDVLLSGLRVGQAKVSLRFSGHEEVSRVEVIEQQGNLRIEVRDGSAVSSSA